MSKHPIEQTTAPDATTSTVVPLAQGWTLRSTAGNDVPPQIAANQAIAASVPGCVHTDLLAARLIPEPYYDINELKLEWIGCTDWEYRCRFDAEAALLQSEQLDLVCEGLDTLATVTLNGQTILTCDDMFIGHRIPVRDMLRESGNELVITFAAPVTHIHKVAGQIPDFEGPSANLISRGPFNFLRKMACNFGWDWGPGLTTCGIWKPIYLHAWSAARIEAVRPRVSALRDDAADVRIDIDLGWSDAADAESLNLAVNLQSPAGRLTSTTITVPTGQKTASAEFAVAQPELWWPRGYGDQPLYTLTVELADDQQQPLDRWSRRTGLRTVKLDTAPDDIGSKFTLHVNGRPVFSKGANWIPDDCFVTRLTRADYEQRIGQAVAANMNMLRIWGGGIFESHQFYETCDRLGVMVMQDFLFACAMYPEHLLGDRIETEARQNVARLASHPSLVIFNGSNENIWFFHRFEHWKKCAEKYDWGQNYYLKLLPALVNELTPDRAYTPSSPFSNDMAIHPSDDRHGTLHEWTAWNRAHYSYYRTRRPRYANEFGWIGPANYSTYRHCIPDGRLQPDSPSVMHHNKQTNGPARIAQWIEADFGPAAFANFDDWHYHAQLIQARAMQCAVEWFRSLQPRCMGAVFWQLNDCWPVASWAAIDSEGKPKPLWFAARRFFADHLLTIQPGDDDRQHLFVINDSDQPWQGEAKLARVGLDGKQFAACKVQFVAQPRTCIRIADLTDLLGAWDQPIDQLLVADADGQRATWFFQADKQLDYPKADFEHELVRSGDVHQLTIRAKTLMRDVILYADRLDDDAQVSDQVVTLLPGDSFTFTVRSSRNLIAADLIDPKVLRCVQNVAQP
ncbi:MAG: glycoside hydrolase family 2 protein [Phycisphaeraceae bacterium]|nr:glycoside hydrolase family 2 protein [Phycisphaeraceae bacterium]